MGQVSNHQLSAFTSPTNGTSPIDANTVRGNDNTVKTAYNAHDADATIHVQNSVVLSRPAASTAGQMWLTTDTGAVTLNYDTGSAWVDISYLSLTGGTVAGATTFSAAVTLSAKPILSTLTASVAVFSDASKGLVSNAITGTGNVVMSASPTLTGTIGAASMTLSGTLGLTGALTYGGVTLSAAVTGTGNMVLSASPTLTGTITCAAVTASGLVTANAGVTVASGQTLTVTGATVTGLTAASVGTGTFPGVYTITGAVTLTAALTANAGVVIAASQALTGTVGSSTISGFLSVSATTFTGNLTGNVTGNVSGSSGSCTGLAATATALATARAINGVNFDGTAAITVTADANTLSGTTLKSTVVTSSLTTVGALNAGSITSGFGAIDVGADAITGGAASFTTGAFSGALTYGGVTLSNAVTGTGNMVLSASPTLTGTITAAIANFSGAVGITGNLTVGASAFVVTAATGAVAGTGQITVTNAGFTATSTAANLVAHILNRPDTSHYVIQSFRTANAEQWAVGLRESPTDNNFRFFSGSFGADVLSLNVASGLVTCGAGLAITGALTGVTTFSAATSIAINGKLFVLGANDSAGAGYRTVVIQNA